MMLNPKLDLNIVYIGNVYLLRYIHMYLNQVWDLASRPHPNESIGLNNYNNNYILNFFIINYYYI
jgi:hypothetical protein